MALFRGAKKDDLRLIASEMNLIVDEKMTITTLNDIIEGSEMYKNKIEFVNDLANTIIENRKLEEKRQIDLENIKLERTKIEFELAKFKADKKSDTSESEIKSESLDQVIKSIRTLTVKIPVRPEGWGFFFNSLERAFSTKKVLEQHKSEILLNLLGDKASNIIIYLNDQDIADYEKIKAVVLREFQPTPYSCLESFRKAVKLPYETHVQFASRLVNSWNYYLKLRDVNDFETLKQLIVSDKLYQTLDRETASHISVRQGDKWFPPGELGKEIDLFFTSRGKNLTENFNASRKNNNSKNVAKVFLSDVKTLNCSLCHENHSLWSCPSYLKLSVNDRIEFIKSNKLCFNCLRNHAVSKCTSRYSCFCGKRHHKSIHFPKANNNTSGRESFLPERNNREKIIAAEDTNSRQLENPSVLNANADEFIQKTFISNYPNKKSRVLLSTVVCFIIDKTGRKHRVKCLLDVGSESNFLSRNILEMLQLKKEKTNILVSGLNDATLTIKHRVNASICNRDESFIKNLEFLIVPKITADLTPSRSIEISKKDFPNVQLADDRFNIPEHVDMLLGAGVFYELLKPEQIRVNNSELILQDTVFGFVVSGKFAVESQNKTHCGLLIEESNLDLTLKKFWEIENIEVEKQKNEETLFCEKHYMENYTRDKTGRYVVKMPLKENPVNLGYSRNIALKRLNSLWNRLAKDPEYLKLYCEFLKEYQQLGHMREISESEEEKGSYYIPHLGVYRGLEKSKSTPLRVVFNASSLTTKGNSLNSIQYNGGVIQDELFSIMVRFRKYIFAFTADIQKMYRAISIHPDQRKLQRILWKKGPREPIKTYELTTVTYGTTSAPFLATRTLRQLAADEGDNFPIAAPVLLNDMYIDDVLSGAETINEAQQLQSQLIGIFEKAGMILHKWCSNEKSLVQGTTSDYMFSNPEEIKTLGIFWNPINDSFSFKVKIEKKPVYTKRDVLSTIARLFDPLGLLGPAIAKAKILLQQLWLLKIDWSDPLPSTVSREWNLFLESLQYLNNVVVERCILVKEPKMIELHGFSDASESGYGAAIYCKSITATGEKIIKLISSKSRVSPLKKTTIPRLELVAAVLLAKLMTRVKSALKLTVNFVFLWCDSMIVLSWIRKEPYQLKTFVANRITTIQELTQVSQWRHVSSGANPADMISRGVTPKDLIDCSLWWNGPEFLITDEYPDKLVPDNVIQDELTELKPVNNFNFNSRVNSFLHDLLNITNNYFKIVRILSFIFRFLFNSRSKTKKNGALSSEEIRNAELRLVKIVQEQAFNLDITKLKNCDFLSNNSPIRNLNPFLGKDGLLRVGGRLRHSNLNYDHKYPILLPSQHKLTYLIIEYFHKKYFHAGPQALLHQIRQQYWIINGRSVCRKIVFNCVTCFKAKPRVIEQLMGDLPESRVKENLAFNITGADFCGPFYIKYKGQRKGIYHKIYICIFICFVTKAMHLELVSDMTSAAFIAALKRFISRRGKCAKLFSDNAKNFVGASIELKKLHKLVMQPDEILTNYMSFEGIDWKFIPPRAPNFGGIWEAGVKSIKYYLKRTVGNLKLTYEEFLTILVQIEGMLNSRPLVPLSADIDDLNVLTPSHFLIGRPITYLAEPDVTNINENRLSLWQKLTKIMQVIWKRWSADYLSNLQQRNKWKFEKNNVKVGDLVIVKEDNLPPCQWSLGRINEIYPGKDGKIRVVDIKTASGIYKRPISKLCLLPIEE